ncbi:hypothetical protein ALQ95_01210 [Pseudomonas syringae pv. ribicola]|uniref:Uncharacterized protein n=1 Tax=Pseudomonas syringae pv. ribicola TaxID=55398 RepID=A0A3M2VZP9_PSESI|nr:hypothetical protein ALQ95_01210 [Pseudomonas syringae pv. ribicola]
MECQVSLFAKALTAVVHSRSDAERPERHADVERRTIVIVEIIVPYAPAWECRS